VDASDLLNEKAREYEAPSRRTASGRPLPRRDRDASRQDAWAPNIVREVEPSLRSVSRFLEKRYEAALRSSEASATGRPLSAVYADRRRLAADLGYSVNEVATHAMEVDLGELLDPYAAAVAGSRRRERSRRLGTGSLLRRASVVTEIWNEA
jgi:hypothetical protein